MKRIIPASIFAALVTLIGLLVYAPSAFAFDPPWPNGIPWPTTVPWPTANPLQIGVPWSPLGQPYVPPAPAATPTPLPPVNRVSLPIVPPPPTLPAPTPVPPPPQNTSAVSAVVPAPANTGNGVTQSSALNPDDTWRTLGAGSSVWYRIGADGVHMDVWLDSNPAGGMSLVVFAPNGSNKPIGNGTPANGNPARLQWSGGNWRANGFWYALVTNGNPFPIQYKLGRNQNAIVKTECHSYWEYIGTNHVFWTICD